MEGLYTWEASSFSVAGTSSTTKGFPSSLHIAARYIRGLTACEWGERKSTFLACTDRPKGRKSLSGTVRKAAMFEFITKYARVGWQGKGQGSSLFYNHLRSQSLSCFWSEVLVTKMNLERGFWKRKKLRKFRFERDLLSEFFFFTFVSPPCDTWAIFDLIELIDCLMLFSSYGTFCDVKLPLLCDLINWAQRSSRLLVC